MKNYILILLLNKVLFCTTVLAQLPAHEIDLILKADDKLPTIEEVISHRKEEIMATSMRKYSIKNHFKFFSEDTVRYQGRKQVRMYPKTLNDSLDASTYMILDTNVTKIIKPDTVVLGFHSSISYAFYDTPETVDEYKEDKAIFKPYQFAFWENFKKNADSLWIEKADEPHAFTIHRFTKNSGEIYNIHTTVTCIRADFIPIKYSLRLEFENMSQYEEASIQVLESHNTRDAVDSIALAEKEILNKYFPHESKEVNPEELAPTLKIGQSISNWKAHDTDGNIVELSKLKGKIVLLDFWYRGCYPCLKSMPVLERLHQKYKEKGLCIIGVNHVDHPDQIKKHMEYKQISYPTVINKDLAKQYNIISAPTFILLDAKQQVIAIEIGYSESLEEVLERQIESLLR